LSFLPIAAETGIIAAIMILKHPPLAIIVGSPLAAAFQNYQAETRSRCPLAKS
jgi:hypothetical protein